MQAFKDYCLRAIERYKEESEIHLQRARDYKEKAKHSNDLPVMKKLYLKRAQECWEAHNRSLSVIESYYERIERVIGKDQ